LRNDAHRATACGARVARGHRIGFGYALQLPIGQLLGVHVVMEGSHESFMAYARVGSVGLKTTRCGSARSSSRYHPIPSVASVVTFFRPR
jgi:hypothetical protein